MKSFQNKKQLRVVVTLGTGKFSSSTNNRIVLEGFRAIVEIDKAGGMMMGELRAKVFGVRAADMNAITTLQWRPGTLIPNTVEVFAIDGDSESLIFAGNIVNAWGDFQATPDVFLNIKAQSAYVNQIAAASPTSFKGATSVSTAMAQIAKNMGLVFENNGVDVTLSDLYLANTLTEQARELSRVGNFDLYIDDKVLAITPRFSPRRGITPVISSSSGLVGYPTFDGIGVTFQTLFNPAITFGGPIKLETELSQAAGDWVVASVAHRLESEKPNGVWFSTIRGNRNGLAVIKR